MHRLNLHYRKRMEDNWEVPNAVEVRQWSYEGEAMTELNLWVGRARAPQELLPVSNQLTVNEARGLRDGLTAAIKLMEALASAICRCGEPLIDDSDVVEGKCGLCVMSANRQRVQPRLRLVAGGRA